MITEIEKEKLRSLVESKESIIDIDYETDFGINFNLPGHEMYIFNEGDGWMYQIRSEFIEYTQDGEDFDTLDDLLDELPV